MRDGGVLSALLALAAAAQEPGGSQSVEALRDFSTDRPDKTESPFTVDRGRWQVEAEPVGFTRDRERVDGVPVRTERLGVGAFNLKLGVAHRADVQLIVEPYVRETVTVGGAQTRRDGLGDVTLRLKRNLWGDDGGPTALAVMPFVTLPTSGRGLGAGRVEGGVIVPFAWALAPRVGLGAMTEVDLVEGDDGDYRASFVNSATIGVDVTERLGAYVELFTERRAERGADWVVTGDLGVTFMLADDLQLDTGANIGLTRAADDLNVFFGVSRRF